MYKLYPLGFSESDPNKLWLDYEWGPSFDNSEWRPCVAHFMTEVAARGYEAVALSRPLFRQGEDFVEISYLLDGTRTTFFSDHLLGLIEIKTDDPRVLRDVWDDIDSTVGWTR